MTTKKRWWNYLHYFRILVLRASIAIACIYVVANAIAPDIDVNKVIIAALERMNPFDKKDGSLSDSITN